MLVKDQVLEMIRFMKPYLVRDREHKRYFELVDGERTSLLELQDKSLFTEWFSDEYYRRFHKHPSRIAILACLNQAQAEASWCGRKIEGRGDGVAFKAAFRR